MSAPRSLPALCCVLGPLLLLAACKGSDSSGGGGGATETAADKDAAETCVDTINAYRATLGLPAYARWADQEACADGEAEADATASTAHGAFGTCGEVAQNECPGWPGPAKTMIPECLKMMWGEGPGSDFSSHGHYINMSNPSYTKVACGFTTLADGSVWAAQDFE